MSVALKTEKLGPLLDFASELQCRYEQQTSAASRKEVGQFFTPPAISRFMASLFPQFNTHTTLLDPGAGLGSLSTAICEKILCFRSPRTISLHLFENDARTLPFLQENMEHCRRLLGEKGHTLQFTIHDDDFLLSNVGAMLDQKTLFENHRLPEFDAIITNPPYFKIIKASEYARVMAPIVHGQPNIYSMFLAVSTGLLKPGGSLVAITPRSFCNGLYFREFRRWLLGRVALEQLHLFESRSKTFQEAKVLQESLISHWRRGEQSENVTVTTSHCREFTGLQRQPFPTSLVIDDSGGEMLLRVPQTSEDAQIIECIESWPRRFQEQGLRISTGPIVMFRAKQFLRDKPNSHSTIPLLSAHNVKPFKINWPVSKAKWPLAFADVEESQKHLVPTRNYVLLKRFTSKEERRRLTAGCLLRNAFSEDRLALENHINYVYHGERDLTVDETFGIAALFNSALLDRYFRTISGNTQVNATEIRQLRFPDISILTGIGRRVRRSKTVSSQQVELLVLEGLGINGSLQKHLVEASL